VLYFHSHRLKFSVNSVTIVTFLKTTSGWDGFPCEVKKMIKESEKGFIGVQDSVISKRGIAR
jgi:hypothetical protein